MAPATTRRVAYKSTPLSWAPKEVNKRVRFACDQQSNPMTSEYEPLIPVRRTPILRLQDRAGKSHRLDANSVTPTNSAARTLTTPPGSDAEDTTGEHGSRAELPGRSIRRVSAVNDLRSARDTPAITLTQPDAPAPVDTDELRLHMKRRLTVRNETGELRSGLPVQRKLRGHIQRDPATPGMVRIRPDSFEDETVSIIRKLPRPEQPKLIAQEKIEDRFSLLSLSDEFEWREEEKSGEEDVVYLGSGLATSPIRVACEKSGPAIDILDGKAK